MKVKRVEATLLQSGARALERVVHDLNLPKRIVQDKHAKSRANEIGRHEVKIDAEVVGDPNINVGMGLHLSGTGYWDQVYEMDTVSHSFGMAGHVVRIVARSRKASGSGESSYKGGNPDQAA